MIIAAMAVIAAYYSVSLRFFQILYPPSRKRLIVNLMMVPALTGAYLLMVEFGFIDSSLLVIMGIMLLALKLGTNMNISQSLFAAGASVISAYSIRGVLSVLAALILRSDKQQFINYSGAYYTITVIALPLTLLMFFAIQKTILPNERLKRFLNNSSHIKLVAIYEIAAAVNLLFIRLGRNTEFDGLWYLEVMLGASLLTVGMLFVVVFYSVKTSELAEHRTNAVILSERFDEQLKHYKTYKKQAENFRRFRHDFDSAMAALQSLIKQGENNKAQELLENISHSIDKNAENFTKTFSDNAVLDCMLNDFLNRCGEHSVKMSFKGSAPNGTGLTLLEAIRVFSNLTSNALEACLKIPEDRRMIDITCSNTRLWASLRIKNTYDGNAVVKKGEYISTKADKYSHGLGLQTVKEICEGHGGIFVINTSEPEVFIVEISVPKKGAEPIT